MEVSAVVNCFRENFHRRCPICSEHASEKGNKCLKIKVVWDKVFKNGRSWIPCLIYSVLTFNLIVLTKFQFEKYPHRLRKHHRKSFFTWNILDKIYIEVLESIPGYWWLVLVSLLLTLNIFHTLFYSFYC